MMRTMRWINHCKVCDFPTVMIEDQERCLCDAPLTELDEWDVVEVDGPWELNEMDPYT